MPGSDWLVHKVGAAQNHGGLVGAWSWLLVLEDSYTSTRGLRAGFEGLFLVGVYCWFPQYNHYLIIEYILSRYMCKIFIINLSYLCVNVSHDYSMVSRNNT